MSRNTSRVPLLVVAAVILVVAAIGQVSRDAARGLSLAERIALPILGLSLAFLLFVGVLRSITRQGRKRLQKLRELEPGVVLYTVVATPELREAIETSANRVAPETDLSPHPTLKIAVDGISLWGDDRTTGAPVCVWSAPWSDVGDVADGEFNDHGIRHRSLHLAIGDSGDVPFVLVSIARGGIAVGRKTIEEVKRVLRSHASRPSNGTGRPVEEPVVVVTTASALPNPEPSTAAIDTLMEAEQQAIDDVAADSEAAALNPGQGGDVTVAPETDSARKADGEPDVPGSS